MTLTISIFSDVICPWCYLGKRRLERALDETGLRATTRVAWLPFELNPDMPEDGMPRSAYRAAKFGAEKSARLDAEMTERGREEGVVFAFDRIDRTPNTRKAHRLIAHASKAGRGDATKTALLRAYFEEGRDIGDPAVLAAIGATQGFDAATVAGAFADPAIDTEIDALERQAAEMGVSGVPFFVVDRRWAISGAQSPEAWIAALRERELGVPANAAG